MAIEMRLVALAGNLRQPIYGPCFVCDHSHTPIEIIGEASFGWRTPNGALCEARHLFVVKNIHVDAFTEASGGSWLWSPLGQLAATLMHNAGATPLEAHALVEQACRQVPPQHDLMGPRPNPFTLGNPFDDDGSGPGSSGHDDSYPDGFDAADY